MSRDGLMPEIFSRVHPTFKTPHIVTMMTGAFVSFLAALFPVGKLADISNSGTLFAFFVVSLGVLILRKREPTRHHPLRTPLVWIVCPLSIIGCAFLFTEAFGLHRADIPRLDRHRLGRLFPLQQGPQQHDNRQNLALNFGDARHATVPRQSRRIRRTSH